MEHVELQESDEEVAPRHESVKSFDFKNETGERGADPESNQLRDTEKTLVGSKKDKMMEVFRNSTEIRGMLVNTNLNYQRLDL